MRRFVYLFVLVCVSTVSSMAASPGIPYVSPHTDLRYRYLLQGEGTKGESWNYWIRTEDGELRLTVRSDENRLSVTTDLEGSVSTEVVTLAPPAGTGVAEIELAWPERRIQARYLKEQGRGGLDQLSGWAPDCESLVEGELAGIKRTLLERVGRDFVAYVEAPRHLETLVVALHSARYLPLLAADCEDTQQPAGGACYYDYQDYGGCVSCCETYSGITSAVCLGAYRRICRWSWCMGGGLFVCNGAVEFAANTCSRHNCRGKPGDPGCDPSQPCEGTCMNFCGPGWSSGCGHCDGAGSNYTACCR